VTVSALYLGAVRHRRYAPVPHAFRFPLFMAYLDLAELPGLFDGRWLWSAERPALAWFRRADHLGDPARPLDAEVRALVAARLGWRPEGPVRLLTHLRYLGYGFNPVSFYYCFDAAGERVEAIVAEVNNTPWNEQHCYVLDARGSGPPWRFALEKVFHVSPFMPMEQRYAWRLTAPGRALVVHMENHEGDRRVFDATLTLRRAPMQAGAMARALVRYPFMTVQVVVGIYWQALRLWLKRVPISDHPSKAAGSPREQRP